MVAQLQEPLKPKYRLTPRQIEVVKLVARGYSKKEIGAKLGISEKTVVQHAYVVGEAFGGFDRVAMTHYALQRGWIELGDYRT